MTLIMEHSLSAYVQSGSACVAKGFVQSGFLSEAEPQPEHCLKFPIQLWLLFQVSGVHWMVPLDKKAGKMHIEFKTLDIYEATLYVALHWTFVTKKNRSARLILGSFRSLTGWSNGRSTYHFPCRFFGLLDPNLEQITHFCQDIVTIYRIKSHLQAFAGTEMHTVHAYCTYSSCTSYSWYGLWYVWLIVVSVLISCCSGCAAYWRRKRMLEQMQQNAVFLAPGQMPGQCTQVTTDMAMPPAYGAPGPQGVPNVAYNLAYQHGQEEKKDAAPPPSYEEAASPPANPPAANPPANYPANIPPPYAPSGADFQPQNVVPPYPQTNSSMSPMQHTPNTAANDAAASNL
ncbi:hypothetical protein CAPTEDRAFT_225328 [Capitella teleta]|uniref:Uncharacterized protein n=1 Tax=Capitella teleta TaxID=283909 RepID=R7U5V2_CAPTE|nr:hypothetical protein CAPTEDRAFT_225328 [Capitella teleta]|eukprot:ELT98535.1 hypothetical protein CAPTEDRAFT_225328 [Capitella teleta]